MPSGLYNRGKKLLVDGTAPWASATDFRVLLATSAYVPSALHNTVADVVAAELSTDGGYERKTLNGEIVSEDDTAGRAELDADDVVWPALRPAGGVPAYAIVYLEGASDAARQLIGWCDLAGDPPIGGSWTARWNADGMFHLT